MIDILHYSFFQNALLGALLASVVCGIVGTYIVTRRLVFISGGITHASFGGIGLGVLMGINPILSAMIFAVLSAFGVEWMSRKGAVREDSAIAIRPFFAWRALGNCYPLHGLLLQRSAQCGFRSHVCRVTRAARSMDRIWHDGINCVDDSIYFAHGGYRFSPQFAYNSTDDCQSFHAEL